MLAGELKCGDQQGLHGFGGFLGSLRVIADSCAARDAGVAPTERPTCFEIDDYPFGAFLPWAYLGRHRIGQEDRWGVEVIVERVTRASIFRELNVFPGAAQLRYVATTGFD